MRRPSRNIEIFSMSVLDMFASALGAFIMITIILFPFYNKQQLLERSEETAQGVDRELQLAIERLRSEEETSSKQKSVIATKAKVETESKECKRKSDDCQVTLARKFLVVQIQWRERSNVNLMIVDPDNNRFAPDKHNRSRQHFPASEAQLSIDMPSGPGIEIWQHPATKAGDYKVIYRATNMNTPSVKVEGWYIHRNTGRVKLPDRTVTAADVDVPVITLSISQSGRLTAVPAN
jgi:hypothetical protein